MSRFKPVGVETLPTKSTLVTGRPSSCYGQLRERSRFEWRISDTGDPAQLLEDFLESNGLTVRNIAGIGGAHTERCGASVFVSAAAGARMIGAPVGRPSPAPRVPDVVAVVYAHGETVAQPREEHERWRLGPWRDSWTAADHAAAVERARAAIGRGDVYQVNVVGHASAPYTGGPLPALRALAGLPGARYAGVLSGRGWAIGCASPETLVEVRGGRIVTRPIKGTRPATAAGRRELLASAKERAEHIMIVDLERNDLARLAETGTVRVDDLYALRRWCDLWQAESVVSALPAPGIGLADLLRAVCPGGSVTGAPKLSALREIAAMEPVGRGASMGALGWVGPDHLDLGLTIRTAAAADSRVHLWAGGGITWSSDAEAEVAEAAAKAAPLRRALAGAQSAA
ncbi:chorismate-binding protein [Micromonospora sp. CPCC 205371]|nr:chorismate-binding protein [Micromonospora sp. CPCC 205371]